jgi:hypothetical protein
MFGCLQPQRTRTSREKLKQYTTLNALYFSYSCFSVAKYLSYFNLNHFNVQEGKEREMSDNEICNESTGKGSDSKGTWRQV